MVIYLILALISLVFSVSLFLNYNNGKGGPIGSTKKKTIFFLSLICFLAFVFFSVKSYHYNYTKDNCQTIKEIRSEISEYKPLTNKCSSLQEKNERFEKIDTLLSDLENNQKSKEHDTFFNIYLTIICTFLTFVIAFTFKNRILG